MSTRKESFVIKVGGSFFSLLDEKHPACDALFQFIHSLLEKGHAIVLVHGGGEQVLQLFSSLGKKSEKYEGLRITPKEDIGLVTAVLAGQLNKMVVSKLNTIGITSVGLSLADGDISSCEKLSERLGHVGKPIDGKTQLLSSLANMRMLPVIASIGADSSGELLNINADHAAIHVANLLSAKLIFLSEVKGVLGPDRSLIPYLDENRINQLIEAGVITDGMTIKVKAALEAANQLNNHVTIASWHSLLETQEIDKLGTTVVPSLQQDN